MARPRKNPRIERLVEHYHIYLRRKRPEDNFIADIIERLQLKSQWSEYFRRAILVYQSLVEGRIEKLVELFPGIVDKILLTYAIPAQNQELIEEFRQLLLARQSVHELPALAAGGQQSGGPRQLGGAKVIEMPTFDDETDEVVVRRDAKAGGVIMGNFMSSVMGLQGGDDDET